MSVTLVPAFCQQQAAVSCRAQCRDLNRRAVKPSKLSFLEPTLQTVPRDQVPIPLKYKDDDSLLLISVLIASLVYNYQPKPRLSLSN